MRDFLPLEKTRRDQVLTTIRETYLGHGFQEIETPALEDLERLTSGQGGDNEKLAFRVMKRGAELESALASNNSDDNLADLGLRYDLTVPLTRYYATNRAKLPTVFKALQTGPVWRAERPQKGRYRQFVQCDIDIIGDASILAEIELLNAHTKAMSFDAIYYPGLKVDTGDLKQILQDYRDQFFFAGEQADPTAPSEKEPNDKPPPGMTGGAPGTTEVKADAAPPAP